MSYLPLVLLILAVVFVAILISTGYVKMPNNDLSDKRRLVALFLFGTAIFISVWLVVKK